MSVSRETTVLNCRLNELYSISCAKKLCNMVGIERDGIGNHPRRAESTTVNIVSEPVPVIRKNRARRASIVIFSITAALVLVFCFITGKVVEYHPDTSSCSTHKNTTRLYLREEKYAFPGLFTTALGLLSIVIGTLVDRFSLVFEERHHLMERYGGSRKKMIKACFSGIQRGPVICLSIITFVIVVVLIKQTDMPYFEVRYLVTIFGGIGVGPLVMHLLNLNTQSEVHISTILEEIGTYVAQGLAWSYYFNYLEKALPKFCETFPNKSIPSKINGELRGYLSSDKMLLLISHNCHTEDNLAVLDNKIEKLYDIKHGVHCFPVYGITYNGTVRKYVVKYVQQPLETLKKMSIPERIKALNESELEYQVKLLYRTLLDILNDPFNKQCTEKCILIPIKAKSLSSLQDGELARLIIHKVERDEHDGTDGFMKPCSAKKQQPKLPKEDDDQVNDKPKDQVNLPTCSYEGVDMNPAERSVRYSRQEEFPGTDNPGELEPMLPNNDGKSSCVEHPERNVNESEQAEDDDGGFQQHERNDCPIGEQVERDDPSE